MKFVKFCAVVALACSAMTASADDKTITVTNLYGVGGGIDNIVSGMIPSLERQGFTVNKNFVKSCVDGYRLVNNQPENHIMVAVTGDIALSDRNYNGLRCTSLAKSAPSLELFSSMGSAPVYMCSSPKFEGTSIEKLRAIAKTERKVVFGIGTSAHKNVIDRMIKNQIPDLKYTVVMYKGGAEITAAARAGDIDYVVGATVAVNVQKLGGTCVAVSDRNDKTYTYMGAFDKSKPVTDFHDYVAHFLLFANVSQMSPRAAFALKIAMQSPEFLEASKKNGYTHRGIGAGVSPAETIKENIIVEKNYVFDGK